MKIKETLRRFGWEEFLNQNKDRTVSKREKKDGIKDDYSQGLNVRYIGLMSKFKKNREKVKKSLKMKRESPKVKVKVNRFIQKGTLRNYS